MDPFYPATWTLFNLRLTTGFITDPDGTVGGLSGSGKSRLARVLGPHIGMAPGARVIRSDITRKRLAGVTSLTRLGDEGYTPEMTERTFEAVYQQTRIALAAGQSVIADTVFAKPEQRHAIAAVADESDGIANSGALRVNGIQPRDRTRKDRYAYVHDIRPETRIILHLHNDEMIIHGKVGEIELGL